MSKNNYLQGKFSGSLNLMSISTLLALSACANQKTEMVEVEDYYRGGALVSRQVMNSNAKQEKELQPIQPIKTKTVKRESTRVKVIPTDDYALRRSVSVIPDNGKVYVKRTPENNYKRNNGVHNIVSQYGENHTVNISQDFPNMIITPFESAKAMGMDSQDYDMGNNGKAILIKPKTAKKLWISITDANNSKGVPISLTLIPKKGLNSQTIIASIATGATNTNAVANSYPQSLSDILRAIADKKMPNGFISRPLNHSFEMANGVSVKPVEQYSSNRYDIYRYRLTNRTGQQQILAEEMFATDTRVVAVSFYPKTILNEGDKTDVMIMVIKGE